MNYRKRRGGLRHLSRVLAREIRKSRLITRAPLSYGDFSQGPFRSSTPPGLHQIQRERIMTAKHASERTFLAKPRHIGWRGVINRCRKGERLYKQHAGKRVRWLMHPSGVAVPARAADLAMRSSELVPAGGDLCESNWQTWIARRG